MIGAVERFEMLMTSRVPENDNLGKSYGTCAPNKHL
jgi:hypothetical protein